MDTENNNSVVTELIEAFNYSLTKVSGRGAVLSGLKIQNWCKPCHVIAIGKASESMMQGACEVLGDNVLSALLITKTAYLSETVKMNRKIICMEAGHPVPNQSSLIAAEILINKLQSIPAGSSILFLISGGSSSLVEKLNPRLDLEWLQKLNSWLLSSGLDIHQMNRIRKCVSQIKGGGLLAYLPAGCDVLNLLISDVPSDNITDIGSGLLTSNTVGPEFKKPESESQLPQWISDELHEPKTILYPGLAQVIAASNCHAREAAAEFLSNKNQKTWFSPETFNCAQDKICDHIMEQIETQGKGTYIWGGETTVESDKSLPAGGRNQQLALKLALLIQHKPNITVLSIGTDGSDGTTPYAGAWVDSNSVSKMYQQGIDAAQALAEFQATPALESISATVTTGVTGTNVMDLVLIKKNDG